MSNSLQLSRLLCPCDSPGKNSGVGCHFLLHGIFLTQGLKGISCIGRQIPYHSATWEALLRQDFNPHLLISWHLRKQKLESVAQTSECLPHSQRLLASPLTLTPTSVERNETEPLRCAAPGTKSTSGQPGGQHLGPYTRRRDSRKKGAWTRSRSSCNLNVPPPHP